MRSPAGTATDARACPLESVLNVPRLTDALAVSVNGAGERERHAGVAIVQVAERALVAGDHLSDERRVRGLDPCRVSRHNLQKLLQRREGRNVGAE